jgi:hypothetical protein
VKKITSTFFAYNSEKLKIKYSKVEDEVKYYIFNTVRDARENKSRQFF